MQSGEAALHPPTALNQHGTVSSSAVGNARGDPAGTQQPPARVVVIATVGEQCPGLATGSATEAADRRERLPHHQKTSDSGSVPTRAPNR